MKTIDYKKTANLKHMPLDAIYEDLSSVVNILDENITNIINTEAPLTLNTLKARMREVFDVKKISGKALDIIMDRLCKLGFNYDEELYDLVIWPKSGQFNVDYLRVGSDRLIYDIPKSELVNLRKEYSDLSGEELYRKMLAYFGLEVLTEKANNYLAYIEK